MGQHPYVVSLLKGILNKRPPKPRYSQTWDVSFALLDLNHYRLSQEGITFTLMQTKTTRPDEPVAAIFSAFPEDTRLCPVAFFNQYIKATTNLRPSMDNEPRNLFISYIKPHRPVSPATIARWIRELLAEAGIDIFIFKAHSVRGASTTAAANALVPLDEILKWPTGRLHQRSKSSIINLL